MTRQDQPGRKPVPIDNGPKAPHGSMEGTVAILGDIVGPIDVEVTADSENVLGERIVFWPE